jgi:MFS superfamily sulfate permease-like transporter
LLAWLFKLGFLADFLSQTVLVGFLTGVGFQVGIAMFGEMPGVPVNSNRTVEQLAQVVHGLPQFHVPTLCLAGVVVMIVLVFRRFAPQLPGPLFAVVAAIAASAAFDFSAHGIVLIQRVTGGLPQIGLPNVSWPETTSLLPVAASCFLMIIAQSAATARAYASRHRETLDENADLVRYAVSGSRQNTGLRPPRGPKA